MGGVRAATTAGRCFGAGVCAPRGALARLQFVLLLLFLLAGCGPAGVEPSPASKSPPGFVAVGEHHLSFQPPNGFQPSARVWSHGKEGTLRATDAGADPHREAADRLEKALADSAMDPEERSLELSRFPYVSFEFEPDRDEIYALRKKVDQARRAFRTDPARGKKLGAQVLEELRRRQLPEDLQARVKHYFAIESRRSEARALNWLKPLEGFDPPRALASYRSRYGASTALFVLYRGHLVVFVLSGPPDASEQRLSDLASSLSFDVAAPAVLASATPPPPPSLLEQQQQQREKEEQQRRSKSSSRAWLTLLPVFILLLFTSLPAYLGATGGYHSAVSSGRDVRSKAGERAFYATTAGVFVGCLVASLALFLVAASVEGGGGIMSPLMGWLVITVIMAIYGLVAGLVGGALAGVGAWIGAGSGPRLSGLLAAIFAALGAVVGPFMMGWMPVKKKHRYRSALPVPGVSVQRECLHQGGEVGVSTGEKRSSEGSDSMTG